MEIPYKVSYFLIFSIVPFMGAILLLFIRFLFFEDKDYIRGYNTNKKARLGIDSNGGTLSFKIQLVLLILSMVGLVFTLSAFSSWNYLPVGFTIILSIMLLVFFTIYQLITQFEVERKKRIFKVRNNKNKNYFVTSPNGFSSPIGIEMGGPNSGVGTNVDNNRSKKEILLESLNIENNNGNSNGIDNNENEEDKNIDLEYTASDQILNSPKNENGYFFYKNQIDPKLSIKDKFKTRVIYFIKDTTSTIQYTPKLSLSLIGLALFLAIFIPLAFEGVCICSHPMAVSTRFSRRFQESYCKDMDVCFAYLTLTEDPSSSMILQIHTRNKPSKTRVALYNMDSGSSKIPIEWESSYFISMSDVIKDEPRYISYVEFNYLFEYTNYKFNFTVETKDGPIESENYSFRTFSNHSNSSGTGSPKDFRFVVGGDVSINGDAKDLAKQGHKFKPDLLIVGGDIAYEDGIGSCYRRWDEKIKFFTKYFSYKEEGDSSDGEKNEKVTRLTPLLMSIGNHEGGAFFQTHKQIPFYFKYFLFNIGDSKKAITDRLSYHIHKLPFNTSMTSLDSCVVTPWDQQTQWLDSQWSSDKYANTNKLVVYHHPIYESWGHLGATIPKLAQQTIVPIFDRYQVPFAYENHEHLFKRTKPLYNNQLVNSTGNITGTTYVGDGSWGISYINEKPATEYLPWYLHKRSFCNHLWFTTINEKKIKLEAYDPDGNLLDSIEYIK
ncbi:hypothetical protein DICPUDRAFT_49171 [Dictyostelium purpureum]|uniref:Uncharacterized protein n=1 Tax=Dictyostelium purpureum TaxID=5786 RepID=F0ZSM1_DICPU|nr:uncharacterized protein DICPUDRAFT_49171 [Dictyostelium purpureum]EGC33070.1 hypothetical protein DICPUDRAFT_49171 [Dictyostelium purpureum]|eukprot:XP_003290420.1 hypothetical protein DICPUDRAFT_49171 [Dictyostelium purpureum]